MNNALIDAFNWQNKGNKVFAPSVQQTEPQHGDAAWLISPREKHSHYMIPLLTDWIPLFWQLAADSRKC